MMRMLGFGPKPASAQLKLKLPQLNSFVDLTITGGAPPGTKPGGTGVFSYSNAVGRFRFSAKCVELRGGNAFFAIPERIETLQIFSGASQRTAVRIDATVPAQWRFAPSGKGSGDYVRGSLTDISRSGASLIVDREVKKGTYVETRFSVSTSSSPLVLLGEVMRSSAIESSKRLSLGLRFHGVKPEEDRAIMEFINKRQAERRNRGLA